jgi:hypothetical protein
VPHPGFPDANAEVTRFLEIIGPKRAWAIGETGFHTAARPRSGLAGWLDRRLGRPAPRWTDAEVAEFTLARFRFWADHGARFVVAFQLNDGPEDVAEHRFGWRTCGPQSGCPEPHVWKPVGDSARLFKNVIPN